MVFGKYLISVQLGPNLLFYPGSGRRLVNSARTIAKNCRQLQRVPRRRIRPWPRPSPRSHVHYTDPAPFFPADADGWRSSGPRGRV